MSDQAITDLVRDGVSTLKDVVLRTGAGRCCRPCREEIRTLMAAAAAVIPAAIAD